MPKSQKIALGARFVVKHFQGPPPPPTRPWPPTSNYVDAICIFNFFSTLIQLCEDDFRARLVQRLATQFCPLGRFFKISRVHNVIDHVAILI